VPERAVKTDVPTPAPTMPVESQQSATSGTTESPAPALNTSRETPTADAMLSAQSTATAIKTRRAPNYSAWIPASVLAAPEPTAM